MSTSTKIGSGADLLQLWMAEDAYAGDAKFTVSVDGTQVGGIQTVTASQSAGASQLFNIYGNFGSGAHSVSVNFLNDASGALAGQDRNLYVVGASYDGGPQANANLDLYWNGSQSISVKSNLNAVTIGSGTNTIALSMAEDAFRGNALFTISVDGKQIGDTQMTSAIKSAGQSQIFNVKGNFGPGTHTVGITFLNDAYGGSSNQDRNLYVLGTSVDGTAQSGGTLALYYNSTQNVSVRGSAVTSAVTSASLAVAAQPGPVTIGAGSDTIELSMSEDAFVGNAQFTVSVDGTQIGGVQTATASHSGGESQLFDVKGNFGAGSHTVSINFLNDAYGGTVGLDRNLYLNSLSVDGVTQFNKSLSLYNGGAQSVTVRQPTVEGLSLLGVNLSGGEYGSTSSLGSLGTDYILPSTAELDYYASKGMNVIRLPFMWDRLQPVDNGPLNPVYLAQLDSVVAYANAKGMKVDLDLHSSDNSYTTESVAKVSSTLGDLWRRVATHYASNSDVLFGIMNEPYGQSAQNWATIEANVVKAIRATGATSQEILASGVGSDSGINWVASGNAAVLAATVKDPANNMAFEVHQYFDSDSSGTASDVSSATIGPSRLADVTDWATTNNVKLFLGEFGAASDKASLAALDNTLQFLQQRNDVWQGGTYWAGGPWWGSYAFSVEPSGGTDKAQMGVLTKYVS